MSYNIEIQALDDYVLLAVEGDDFELESWISAVSRAVILCNEENKTKLLVKDLVQEDFSLHEMESLVNRLPELGFNGLKVSIYVANPIRQFVNYFGEGIASRKELNLKVFLNFDSAVSWLRES